MVKTTRKAPEKISGKILDTVSDTALSQDSNPAPSGNITMDDIARLAGVSKPTVSRALNNSPTIAKATREKVIAVARAHGYAINRNARKLRVARSDTIVVILDARSHPWQRIADPFIYELLAGVSEALSIRNLDLLLSPSHLENIQDFKDMLAAKAADGFIFLGQGARDKELTELAREGVPFVTWGAVSPDANYCAIGSDNYRGGALAGQHFMRQGCKNILFLGDSNHTEIRMRRDGLFDTLKKAPYKIIFDELKSTDFSYNGSHALMQDYLSQNPAPDAIFAYSDTSAMAAISALREHNISVPNTCSVVGYNDIPQSEHFVPPLTTIRQDTFSAGAILVEKLVQAIDGARPKSTLLPTNIIVRQS